MSSSVGQRGSVSRGDAMLRASKPQDVDEEVNEFPSRAGTLRLSPDARRLANLPHTNFRSARCAWLPIPAARDSCRAEGSWNDATRKFFSVRSLRMGVDSCAAPLGGCMASCCVKEQR